MIEIFLIWTACSNLSNHAKARGYPATGYCVSFVFVYFVLLAIGAVIGKKLEIHPIAGAYMVGIPGALAMYYILKGMISDLVPRETGPENSTGRYIPPGQYAPPSQQSDPDQVIRFSCKHCGAVQEVELDQGGQIAQCTVCKKTTMVPR